MRHLLSHFPQQELVSNLVDTVIIVRKMKEAFLVEEKLFRDFQEEP
jgi:hypothetical protein